MPVLLIWMISFRLAKRGDPVLRTWPFLIVDLGHHTYINTHRKRSDKSKKCIPVYNKLNIMWLASTKCLCSTSVLPYVRPKFCFFPTGFSIYESESAVSDSALWQTSGHWGRT